MKMGVRIGIQRYRGNGDYSRKLRKILGDISQSGMAAECQFDKSLLEKIESHNPKLRLTRQTVQKVVDGFNKLIKCDRYWSGEPFSVTFEQLCTLIEVEDSLFREPEPEPTSDEALAFSITTIPGVGSNWRPDPDHSYSGDAPTTYCFIGKFHLRVLQDCEVYQIQMHVVREGRYALAGCPGRSEYSYGADAEGRFGSIKLNGENLFLDSNYHLQKIISLTKGSLSSLSTSRYCMATRYTDEIATSSLWYWIEEPEQILEVFYIKDGVNFAELHHFYFPGHVLTFQKATIRRLSESP